MNFHDFISGMIAGLLLSVAIDRVARWRADKNYQKEKEKK